MALDALQNARRLKQSIRRKEPVLGVFIRTPAMHIVEYMGRAGVDYVALDAEHGSFGSEDLDRCILAAHSVGIPVLVRVRETTAASVLEVLDMGASGIIAPHVKSAEAARQLISYCRYSGSRGFSGSSRAAGYGAMDGAAFRKESDQSIVIVAQIEDSEALKDLSAIAAEDDLDALFVGRADLAVSLGVDGQGDPKVIHAVDEILQTGRGTRHAHRSFRERHTRMRSIPKRRRVTIHRFDGPTAPNRCRY